MENMKQDKGLCFIYC